MNSLGLYPLSVVLSFLSETEGTRLLITQKRYSNGILPLFRKRNGLVVTNAKRRHMYVVCPVQDPSVLLERLNTRRLAQRKNEFQRNLTTIELAKLEWENNHCCLDARYELLRLERADNLTLLTSYPRSGNTLLRTLLERCTGQVTGSDTRPNRTLSKSLALQHNLVGEGVLDTPVVKTHYPERSGYKRFNAQRAIILVRNPFDAIDSYWNLCLTNTHTETVTDPVYETHKTKFEGLVQNEIEIWLDFMQYWTQGDKQVLVVRFEDLIVRPQEELSRVLQFVLDTECLSDFWMDRIRHACDNGSSKTTCRLGSYRPRSARSGKGAIGKSLRRYSQELIQSMEQTAQERHATNFLHLYGYSMEHQGFPQNFVEDKAPRIVNQKRRDVATIEVNAGIELRPPYDPYGRAMTPWRRSFTKNDTEPFPTVSRNLNNL